MAMNTLDDFEARARQVLDAKHGDLLEKLLKLRAAAQQVVAKDLKNNSLVTAGAINKRNQSLLDQAAKLLGPNKFQEIFGFSVNERIDLVDPHAIQPVTKQIEKEVGSLRRATPQNATTTVNLKQIAGALAVDHGVAKSLTEAMLDDMVQLVIKHLKKGDRIRFAGLGVLVARRRAARMGRDSRTGKRLAIKASKTIAFRAAKELKEKI